MGGFKNKIKIIFKKINLNRLLMILLFFLILIHLGISIFLLKKNKEDFNNLKHDMEQAIKRLESKTDAFSSQLYRMRLMNQQYYLNPDNSQNIKN